MNRAAPTPAGRTGPAEGPEPRLHAVPAALTGDGASWTPPQALPPHLALYPEYMARFTREARVLASLSHAHIAAIHGLEKVGEQDYLVLEHVRGVELLW